MVISDYPFIFFRSCFLSTFSSSSTYLFTMHVISSTSACFSTLYPNTELNSLGVNTMYTQADLNTFNLSHSQTPPRPSIRPSLSHWYITQAIITMCIHNVPARPQPIILTMSSVCLSVSSSVYSSRPLAHRTKHLSNVLSDLHNDPLYILQSDLHTILHFVFSPQKPPGSHTDVFNDELNNL